MLTDVINVCPHFKVFYNTIDIRNFFKVSNIFSSDIRSFLGKPYAQSYVHENKAMFWKKQGGVSPKHTEGIYGFQVSISLLQCFHRAQKCHHSPKTHRNRIMTQREWKIKKYPLGKHGRDLNVSITCVIPKQKTQDKWKRIKCKIFWINMEES